MKAFSPAEAALIVRALSVLCVVEKPVYRKQDKSGGLHLQDMSLCQIMASQSVMCSYVCKFSGTRGHKPWGGREWEFLALMAVRGSVTICLGDTDTLPNSPSHPICKSVRRILLGKQRPASTSPPQNQPVTRMEKKMHQKDTRALPLWC